MLPHNDTVDVCVRGILFPAEVAVTESCCVFHPAGSLDAINGRRCMIVRISCSVHLNDLRMSFSATSIPNDLTREA